MGYHQVERLEKFLRILKESGLTLRYDKCKFLQSEITFVGHIVNKDCITSGEKNVSAIKSFKVPNNVKDVRQFLGLTGFFRKFVKNYSLITRPLTRWRNDQQRAFNELNDKLCCVPVLVLYDFAAHHEVHTDACAIGLAGVLLQSQDKTN